MDDERKSENSLEDLRKREWGPETLKGDPTTVGKYAEEIVFDKLTRILHAIHPKFKIERMPHTSSFDILITDPEGVEIRVEVKSTTSPLFDRKIYDTLMEAQRRAEVVILYSYPFRTSYLFVPYWKTLYKLSVKSLRKRLEEVYYCRLIIQLWGQ